MEPRKSLVGAFVVVSTGAAPKHRNGPDAEVRPGSKSRAKVQGFLRNVGDPAISTVESRHGPPGCQVQALQAAPVLWRANATGANRGAAKRSHAKGGGRGGRKTQHPRSTREPGEVHPRRPWGGSAAKLADGLAGESPAGVRSRVTP